MSVAENTPLKLVANLSLLYPELPFIERFAAAAADGFRAIEIQFPYDTPAEAIRAELDQYGLRCVLINVPAGDLMSGGRGLACVAERRNEFREALALCSDYVKVLKPLRVNVLAGRCEDAEQSDACLETLAGNLALADSVLAPLGVTTVLEAINTTDMPGFLISTFADMEDMLLRLGDTRVKMQFDVYHMAMMNEPVTELLTMHGESFGHIQFADCPGRHEPGTGGLDFHQLFQCIRESGYDGWVAAEYRPLANPTCSGLAWKEALLL